MIDPDTGIDDEDAAQALALADAHDNGQAAPTPAPPTPGMEGIDVDQISRDIAASGQPTNVQPQGAVVPGTQPPPFVPGTSAPATQVPVGNPPLQAQQPPTREETTEATKDVGAPPTRPKLSGDPAKDVQTNLEWSRQLTDYQTALERKSGEIAKRDADINSRRAEHEAEAERLVAEQRAAEQQAYKAQRAQRQQAIDSSVAEKAAAYSDLKDGGKKGFGATLADAVAIALGGIGQGLMLAGHVQGAKNEGLEAVNRQIAADYQRRKDRLAAASDSVLEARYGFKDAADNHRAALADLDADRAARYRLIAAEAAQQLKAQGASDQDVKTNQVVVQSLKEAAKSEDAIHAREEATQVHRETAAATNKIAEAHLGLAQASLDETRSQHHETAAEARARLDLARQSEADRHGDRQAALDEKKAEKDKAATVGSVRQNAVLGNIAEAEKAVKDVGEVSLDAINKLQTNTEQAKAGEHAATSGVVGNITTRIGRGVGAIARGQYDGISDAEQKKITAANQVITHLTEMQQGKNIETLEQYRDRYSPYVPGLSEAEVRRREKALPGLVAEQRAIQDPQGVGTKRQEAGEKKVGGEIPTTKAAKHPHQDILDLADAHDRGGVKSLVINGKTVHYDATGKRIP